MPCNVNPALVKLCSSDYAVLPEFEVDPVTGRTHYWNRLTKGIKHRDRVRAAVGAPVTDDTHLPVEFSGSGYLEGFEFRCLPGVKTGPVQGPMPMHMAEAGYARLADYVPRPHLTFKHRLEARCTTCNRWIPVGRMHQHAGRALGRKGRDAKGHFKHVPWERPSLAARPE